jgi:chromosome segregation ATPase
MEKDHLEVLLEDIREKFDLVLEGHGALRQGIDNLTKEVRENKDETSFKIDTLHQRIGKMDQKIGKMDQKIGKLDQRVGKMDQKIGKMDQKIDTFRLELKDEIGDIRIDLGGKIDRVAVDLAAHRADTESHPKGYKVSE